MPQLFRILVQEKMVRSRTEAERLIRQGAVSVGGCDPDCGFFETGKCTCNGWKKITKTTEEIEVGFAVKVGNGLWRLMARLDGTSGWDQVNGVGRSREEHKRPKDPNQLAKLVVDLATGAENEPKP